MYVGVCVCVCILQYMQNKDNFFFIYKKYVCYSFTYSIYKLKDKTLQL